MEWQPIETVKKLEDHPLLLTDGEHTTIGAWDLDTYHKKPKPYWSTERGYLFGKAFDRGFNPTHWMELPKPPS